MNTPALAGLPHWVVDVYCRVGRLKLLVKVKMKSNMAPASAKIIRRVEKDCME